MPFTGSQCPRPPPLADEKYFDELRGSVLRGQLLEASGLQGERLRGSAALAHQ
jgi:hypothetical protein